MMLTFRQILGGKKIWLLVLLLGLPILLLVAVLFAGGFEQAAEEEEIAFSLFLYALYPQGLCILASLIYGATLLAGEIEDKTLVYLFTRAQPRWKILVGKYLATSLILGTLTALSLSVAFLVAGRPGGFSLYSALLTTTVAACFAYTAVFALLGLAVPQRAITVGLIYAIVVEFIFSLVPALVNEITVSYYLRSLAFHMAEVTLPAEVDPFFGRASPEIATVVLLTLPLLFLGISAVIIHRREWPLTEGV